MFDLLVATTNPGKIREIRIALSGAPARLLTLEDLESGVWDRKPHLREPSAERQEPRAVAVPEETGITFAENAALKARHYFAASGLPTVAEDSGLVIDALGGRPGVESARYPGATYADKFANLYRELAPHPKPWRARFVCSLAFVTTSALGTRPPALAEPPSAQSQEPRADSVLFTTEAAVEGSIAPQPRGTHGFGYDPILFYPPLGCTLGEATDSQKLAVSHRGKAFRAFRDWLASQ